ncbi:hypothetical protein B0T10DRAFT_18801 [Thelonectria olida]|uniref:Secreted protein n=1 Tax=Thelonectria olida TaxID=1576542 RepID=A0A9P8WKK2_9HYPO|nr:hypothetical protein B0T10DRAFT_18801 [Thelonectria olida]
MCFSWLLLSCASHIYAWGGIEFIALLDYSKLVNDRLGSRRTRNHRSMPRQHRGCQWCRFHVVDTLQHIINDPLRPGAALNGNSKPTLPPWSSRSGPRAQKRAYEAQSPIRLTQ